MAELTDRGRQTTLNLGRRLRHLYRHQLGFLPETISDVNMVYLRSSPWPRTLDSLQQVFTGLYPPAKRDRTVARPMIVTRRLEEEILMPNEDHCERFIQLAKAFSKRTADRCEYRRVGKTLPRSCKSASGNQSPEMEYLNTLLQTWMPSQRRVAVDSTPKLHGIWDTINATLATPGPPTRLPPEFYDARARTIIDRIVTEEEYAGFKESNEYRTVGIGALLGEVVQRMVCNSHESIKPQVSPQPNQSADMGGGNHANPKVALFGCHDSTLAAILASLGALEGENNTWPQYTSSLAIELFHDSEPAAPAQHEHSVEPPAKQGQQQYVRIRYNDSPITIPGCRPPGRHFAGDESFCSLVSQTRQDSSKELGDRFWRPILTEA